MEKNKKNPIFINWRNKKSFKIEHWAVLFSALTLLITTLQTLVVQTQAEIMKNQSNIAVQQSELLSNQIESTTRPVVDIQQQLNENHRDSIIIRNFGHFKIKNIKIRELYFVYVEKHGWLVSIPGFGTAPDLDSLKPGGRCCVDVDRYTKTFPHSPMVDYPIREFSEFLVFLVSFERNFDGKGYIMILPNRMIRRENKTELWPDGPSTGYTGALSDLCNDGIELTLEYFKRKPFFKDYEIYDTHYILGNTPTGCLGEIKWAK